MRPRQPDESHDRLTGPGGFKAPERRRRAAFSDESNAARMERLIPCFILICMASFGATVLLDPRGARPVEPSTRGDQCATQREWPFCTSDEWIVKCPSGCRIQGLMDKYDHGLLRKIEKIRSLLDQYKAKHRSTDLVSKQTYDFLREKLTLDADGDTKYSDLAMTLRQRIVDMKIKIDRQLRILQALKDRVKDQVAEMQKLEVDIDIKLRSCKGSCQSYTEYQVDQESYVTLDKQVTQLDSQTVQNIETVGTLYVMKSRPLKEDDPGSLFKSKDVDADVFHDVKNVQLSLEMEGTLASPATISKVPVCLRLQSQDSQESTHRTRTHRKQPCPGQSGVTLCSGDDWISKCPSGCRLHGFISLMETEVERKLRGICKTAKTYENEAETSMTMTTHIYNSNRRVLVNRFISELEFVENAEELSRNFTVLQTRSARLQQQLEELRHRARHQTDELYRTEVDIDMKLRACHGSCRSTLPFSVDHSSYETLQTHMGQMQNGRRAGTPPKDVPRVQLRPVEVSSPLSPDYKTIPTVQRELLTQFEDIGQNQLVLEELLEQAADMEDLNLTEDP